MALSARKGFFYAVLGLSILAWIGYLFYRAQRQPFVDAGIRAPDFELETLKGERIRLSSLRGKVVLVNFWATWCAPCRDEMPALERLYQAFRGENSFELLAVSVDRTGMEEVEAFVREAGVTFPVLIDSLLRVSDDYQIVRLPETFLIDTEGVVVKRYKGPREWDSNFYRQVIRQLIQRGRRSAEGGSLVRSAFAAEVYWWRDEEGNIHYVDDLSKIPPSARERFEKKSLPDSAPPVRKESELERDGSEVEGSIDVEVDNEGHTREWWQNRVTSLHQRLSETEEAIERVEEKIFRTTPEGQITELRSHQRRLERLQKERDRILEEIDDLAEEARRAGAPPGWIRID